MENNHHRIAVLKFRQRVWNWIYALNTAAEANIHTHTEYNIKIITSFHWNGAMHKLYNTPFISGRNSISVARYTQLNRIKQCKYMLKEFIANYARLNLPQWGDWWRFSAHSFRSRANFWQFWWKAASFSHFVSFQSQKMVQICYDNCHLFKTEQFRNTPIRWKRAIAFRTHNHHYHTNHEDDLVHAIAVGACHILLRHQITHTHRTRQLPVCFASMMRTTSFIFLSVHLNMSTTRTIQTYCHLFRANISISNDYSQILVTIIHHK